MTIIGLSWLQINKERKKHEILCEYLYRPNKMKNDNPPPYPPKKKKS